jgi:hypothetical protein
MSENGADARLCVTKERKQKWENFTLIKPVPTRVRELASKLDNGEELAVMAIATCDFENRAGELYWVNRDVATVELLDEMIYQIKTQLFELLSDDDDENENFTENEDEEEDEQLISGATRRSAVLTAICLCESIKLRRMVQSNF